MPQSICTHYGLAVGYYASGLLRVLMALSSPIAWPLSRLLDVILGHSTATLPRSQLQQFVALHGEDEGFAALGEALTRNEAQIINCALELTAKTAAAAMTPLHHAFMVSTNDVLDDVLRDEIIQAGHSRVPVHAPGDRTSILGLLLVKDLLLVKVCPTPPPSPPPRCALLLRIPHAGSHRGPLSAAARPACVRLCEVAGPISRGIRCRRDDAACVTGVVRPCRRLSGCHN